MKKVFVTGLFIFGCLHFSNAQAIQQPKREISSTSITAKSDTKEKDSFNEVPADRTQGQINSSSNNSGKKPGIVTSTKIADRRNATLLNKPLEENKTEK